MKNMKLTFLLPAVIVAVLSLAMLAQDASGKHSIPNLALEGNCPVCLVEMQKQVEGSQDYQSAHDGRIYLFPGQKQKEMFDADPEKYIPAYGGKCVVCQVESGKAGPGKAEHFTVHDQRLFLFPSDKVKGMFDRNPQKYAQVGIGMNGYCPVWLQNGKLVRGK
jgi:YHS domain-containing protein